MARLRHVSASMALAAIRVVGAVTVVAVAFGVLLACGLILDVARGWS